MFQPVDVRGPANRSVQIQQLAQGAAQNVMRRNKLRALLSQTLSGSSGAAPGVGNQMRGSFMGRAMGERGDVFNPTFLPGYGHGRPEFGSLPGNDPGQSPGSQGPPAVVPPHYNPPPPGATQTGGGVTGVPDARQTGGGVTGVPNATQTGGGVTATTPGATQTGGGVSATANLIPLGNGLHYDPVNDQVVSADAYQRGYGG